MGTVEGVKGYFIGTEEGVKCVLWSKGDSERCSMCTEEGVKGVLCVQRRE